MPESKVVPVRIAVRIQRRRTRAFIHTSPNGLEIVYVGRPSQWGNPFRVGIDAVRTSHETISVTETTSVLSVVENLKARVITRRTFARSTNAREVIIVANYRNGESDNELGR